MKIFIPAYGSIASSKNVRMGVSPTYFEETLPPVFSKYAKKKNVHIIAEFCLKGQRNIRCAHIAHPDTLSELGINKPEAGVIAVHWFSANSIATDQRPLALLNTNDCSVRLVDESGNVGRKEKCEYINTVY